MSQDETIQEETTDEAETPVETTENDDTWEEFPKDHPLVKTLYKQRSELKELNRKREEFEKAQEELDAFRKSQLSDQERLVEQTKEETAKAVRLEFAEKMVEAELKGQLRGRSLIGDAILEFSKDAFIDDHGNIDSEAIATWVETHSSQTEAPKPDLGQGARGSKSSLAQIRSRDELAGMTPAEILLARKDGRLDSLMGKA